MEEWRNGVKQPFRSFGALLGRHFSKNGTGGRCRTVIIWCLGLATTGFQLSYYRKCNLRKATFCLPKNLLLKRAAD